MRSMAAKPSKSSLFLLELIFSIFFFILASAICIQLFVQSHLIGNQTIERNQYVLWAQNIAESFYSSDDPNIFLNLLPFDSEGNDLYFLYFDKDWNLLSLSTGNTEYIASMHLSSDSSFRYADIKISDSDQVLYELNIKDYIQAGGGN